jgi:hypothetical protein
MIELELGNKEDLLAKGRKKREQTMPEKGQQGFQRVLSENDNTQPPPKPHNTQKAIAKAAGVSTGQVSMALAGNLQVNLWVLV